MGPSSASVTALLPKEHGAYGQLAFPALTALAVSGLNLPAILIVNAGLAAFLAHEPLLVLLGMRGPRARRDWYRPAGVLFVLFSSLVVGSGLLALVLLPPAVRWSLAVPVVMATPSALGIARRNEKTWPSEIGVSLALSTAALPIGLAAGATLPVAAAVTTAFAVDFVLATLAVRAVILGTRAGGAPRQVAAIRRAAILLAGVLTLAMAAACLGRLLPWIALLAAAPGIVVSLRLVTSPPPPSRLRSVGWALIAMSALTSAVLVVGLRWG